MPELAFSVLSLSVIKRKSAKCFQSSQSMIDLLVHVWARVKVSRVIAKFLGVSTFRYEGK